MVRQCRLWRSMRPRWPLTRNQRPSRVFFPTDTPRKQLHCWLLLSPSGVDREDREGFRCGAIYLSHHSFHYPYMAGRRTSTGTGWARSSPTDYKRLLLIHSTHAGVGWTGSSLRRAPTTRRSALACCFHFAIYHVRLPLGIVSLEGCTWRRPPCIARGFSRSCIITVVLVNLSQ